MNKYDKILSQFTGDTGDCSAWCETPFLHGDSIVATDRYILVRVEAAKCEGEYGTHPNQPKSIDKLFPTPNCNFVMNLHELAKQINAIEDEITISVSGDDARCPECGGRGTVEWEYESRKGTQYGDFNCPECDGRGHLKTKTLNLEESNISINGHCFNIGNIMRIANAIYQFGCDTVNVVALYDYKQMAISVEPGVDILAMPNSLGNPATSITLKQKSK